MKMIARMFCAAALVLGALSLTGCADKAKEGDAKADAAKKVEDATKKATDAVKGAADAVKDAAKDAKK